MVKGQESEATVLSQIVNPEMHMRQVAKLFTKQKRGPVASMTDPRQTCPTPPRVRFCSTTWSLKTPIKLVPLEWNSYQSKSKKNLKIGSMLRTNPPSGRTSDGVPWDKTANK